MAERLVSDEERAEVEAHVRDLLAMYAEAEQHGYDRGRYDGYLLGFVVGRRQGHAPWGHSYAWGHD